jgi:hypothetical protein
MINCFAYLAVSDEATVGNIVFPVMFGELAMMLRLVIMGAKEQALDAAAS